jgi:hypothetical protein
MTPHVLDGAFERATRAKEHLLDLRQRLAPLEKHNDVTSVNPDADLRPHTIKTAVPIVIPASMRIPILIGEICYNLRSALDYLVFELAKHDSGTPQKGMQFPIECSVNYFRGNRERFLKGINDAHVAAIEGLQPYNGCIWTTTRQSISNPDKHRELIKLTGEVIATVYVFGEDVGFDDRPFPIHRAPHPISGAEVNVKIDVTHTILRLTNKRVGLQGRAERMLVSGHGPLKVNKRKRSHRERESRRSQSVSTRVAGLWGRWPSRLVRRLPVVGICRCRRRRAHGVEPWL